jgi:hypothetical protein
MQFLFKGDINQQWTDQDNHYRFFSDQATGNEEIFDELTAEQKDDDAGWDTHEFNCYDRNKPINMNQLMII